MFFLSVLLETKKSSCVHVARSGAVRPHRESKRKRWRCDNSEGTARTCDGSATIGSEIANSKCLTWPLAAPSSLAARSLFAPGPTRPMIRVNCSGSACVSECVHRTIYQQMFGADEQVLGRGHSD